MSLPTLQSVFSSDQIDTLTAYIDRRFASSGVVAMTAGAAAIEDATITATSVVVITPYFAPQGVLSVTLNVGVGFSIVSSDGSDAGDVSYFRVVS